VDFLTPTSAPTKPSDLRENAQPTKPRRIELVSDMLYDWTPFGIAAILIGAVILGGVLKSAAA
jgi:hypothetical protein